MKKILKKYGGFLKMPVLAVIILSMMLALAGCGESKTAVSNDTGTAVTVVETVSETAAQRTLASKKNTETTAAEEETSSGQGLLSKIKDAIGTDVTEDGEYTSKEEVALYIHLYGHLPDNYITKQEAKDLGWVSSKGNLGKVAPGKSIGGDRFGNYEGLLPEKRGRKYFECDIDYKGKSRNSKRIVYSNDGLVFYTDDHYESFEQLY